MSTVDQQVLCRHVGLPTQQRRLRHLRSIAVRNITQKGSEAGKVQLSQTETFFTLHKDAKSEAFFTSENIQGSLNPTWRGFNLEHLEESPLCRQPTSAHTFFVVRIWHGITNDTQLFIEWTVNLSGLVFLGEKSHKDAVHFPSNTILFGILDGFYSIPLSLPPWQLGVLSLEVEQSAVRSSYSTQTLLRIKTVMRAIKQTQASVHKIKKTIEGKLHRTVSLEDQRSRGHLQTVKNSLMHSDLEWRASTLQAEKEDMEKERTQNRTREHKMKSQFKLLHDERAALHEKKKGYFDVREDLIKTGAMLVVRRKDLIAELAFIYPINEVNANQFTICNVRLPNSEDFSGQDDIMISSALGYTSHLVEMISKFLDVPIRYPMDFAGSRSLIRDHIIDKLADRERDFPLYSKGREKFQFNYGVYLLNKNIAQLRYYCALATNDLRLTLPNLKALLQFRLGVKFEAANAPVLAGQHMSVPPNLGGPQKSSNPMFGLSRRQSEGSTSQDDPQTTGQDDSSKKTRRRSSSRSKQEDSHSKRHLQNSTESFNDESSHAEREKTVLQDRISVSDTMNSSQTEDDTETEGSVFISNDSSVVVSSDKHSSVINKGHRTDAVTPETESETKTLTENNVDIESESPSSDEMIAGTQNYTDSPGQEPSNTDPFLNEDIKSSSSDENLSATYNSRFKMWANDPSVPLGDESSVDSVNGVIPPSNLTSEFLIPADVDTNIYPTSTFKTKAMTSPTSPVGPSGSCDDLLSKAAACNLEAPRVTPGRTAATSPPVKGPYHRDRTDSDADAEDSATFVIPNAQSRGPATVNASALNSHR